MKSFALVFIALMALMVLPAASYGGESPNTRSVAIAGNLSGVALNAAAATRTLTVYPGKKYAKLIVGVAFTHSAATTLTATPTCEITEGGTEYSLQTRSCASGTCTTAAMSDTQDVSGDVDLLYEYDIRGCHAFKVLYAGASGGASDLITTEAVVIVGD